MAILRTKDIRTMTVEERADELENLNNELVRERALTSAGGAPDNPGRIGEIRRTIARIKTIQHELNDI
ncbi:LSU ribosomal protein L35e (L29p) [Methanosarcina sp. MTP4]|uniref:50S ribosomal protein L29 n=1 Tax=Methanosarcina sp. MTP4 TaxID=1434100 RepID=UPI0006158628|nr:50S ribosomal protein L29 [Methanosarcina sp. MTP4]AKB25943.1 LSU ribosomal protein L35e (L29p) [Methanosarcina sp. MTP4]